MENQLTCVQCQHQINASANYCESCGSKVISSQMNDYQRSKSEVLDEFTKTQRNDRGQVLIFIGLILLCFTTFYYFIVRIVISVGRNWSLYEMLEPISIIMSGIGAGIALLIAFGMNRGTRKTIAIIIASVYTIIHVYWFIDQFVPDVTF